MRSVKSTSKKAKSKKATSKKPAAQRSKNRKKQSRWAKPLLLGFLGLTFLGAPAAGGYYLWHQGIIQQKIAKVEQDSVKASQKAGFVLNEVFVHGRKETNRADILAALNVERGQAIVNFDPDMARQRLEKLGWIESASVQRELPDNIIVRLKERVPAAIWQKGKIYTLVDKTGVKISEVDVDRFTHLKVLTGEHAPSHTNKLMQIIDQVPDLRKRVIGAAWVGDRRWTLHLDNKVSVKLPAEKPELAWRKLAVMIQDHDLLSRDIEMIDLRQAGKTVIRMTGSGAKRLLESEEKA